MRYTPREYEKELACLDFATDGWYIRLVEFPLTYRVEVMREYGKVRYNHVMLKSEFAPMHLGKGNSFTLDDANDIFNNECDKIRFECYSDI